jgi:hypothetical protein
MALPLVVTEFTTTAGGLRAGPGIVDPQPADLGCVGVARTRCAQQRPGETTLSEKKKEKKKGQNYLVDGRLRME